ncbi:rubrerythrin [Desulfitispora alkaliphila]
MSYEDQYIKLDADAVLLLTTDGLLEQTRDGSQYGDRIQALLKQNVESTSGEIVKAIEEDFGKFLGEQKNEDDITLLVLKYSYEQCAVKYDVSKLEEFLEEIKEAIEDDRGAQRKYSSLAQKSHAPAVKAFFQQLVMDEAEHEKLLKSRYQALKKINHS